MNEEQQRIRSYLQAQAAKLSVPELVAKVRADQEQVRVAALAVPPARFATRPADGAWSADEVLAHVVESGAAVAAAIRAVLDGGRPPERLTDQIRQARPSSSAPLPRAGEGCPEGGVRVAGDAAAWLEKLCADREALFARVLRADPGARLDVRWQHPFFGDLNWREWLLFLRLHDLDHARQLQAIAAALG